MRKTLIATAALMALASPALAESRKDLFLQLSSTGKSLYLTGYIAGRDHENISRPGLQDATEVNGPGRLDCGDLNKGEVGQLMLISIRRSSYDELGLALAEAFGRVCKYR